MADVWDVEDVENRGKVPACQRLYEHPEPFFRRVFRNEHFDVLELVRPNDVPSSKSV
jgi:hypothetical protein